MRLLTKISLVYLFITTLVLLVGSVITFKAVQYEVDAEHRRFLNDQLKNVIDALKIGSPIGILQNDKIRINNLGYDAVEEVISYSDTIVLHPSTRKMESNQKLKTIVNVDGTYYFISIHDIIVEPDDIVDAVRSSLWWIFLILIGVFATASVILPWLILRPFNETLEAIRKFSLKDSQPIQLTTSTTKEFGRLNNFILQMTSKSRQDYQSLKEFTENASHEFQTPLAVSRGKLELLLESPNLKKEELELISDAQNSIMKLSRMGRSLALLTKIENQEFSQKKQIDFEKLGKEIIEGFRELIQLKNLTIEQNVINPLAVTMDPALAEILLNNLFQNAIRHNESQGRIMYQLDHHTLIISNTGAAPANPPAIYFQRFKKGNQSRDSIGLGLSIVKQICDFNGFSINYDFKDQIHSITLKFK